MFFAIYRMTPTPCASRADGGYLLLVVSGCLLPGYASPPGGRGIVINGYMWVPSLIVQWKYPIDTHCTGIHILSYGWQAGETGTTVRGSSRIRYGCGLFFACLNELKNALGWKSPTTYTPKLEEEPCLLSG